MPGSGDWIMNPESLPAIVSSSDLFDGELFGDELMDIYNSTVEGHDVNDDLSKLLDSKKGEDAEEMLASIDDGFGMFRPSSSFNDFSSLLSPPAEAAPATDNVEPIVTPDVTQSLPVVLTASTGLTNKRAADSAPLDAPHSPKRKAPAPRRVSAVCKKEEVARSSAVAPLPALSSAMHATKKATSKPKPEDKSTPNPLTTASFAISTNTTIARTNIESQIPKHITTIVTSAIVPVPTEVKSSTTFVAKTEESEFNKMVAQASASTLIHTASGGTDVHVPSNTDSSDEMVDTSTAHIKALTGNNWVAACTGTTQGISSVSSDLDDSKNGCNRNRRQNLSADERARQNRDRNREHARNTRLRKKAYVEELKRTLTELVAQRDTADFEKRQAAQRELEQREVRFRVIEEFLKLRGRNETNYARWAAILEDGFVLTSPMVNFRKMMRGGTEALQNLEQVLNGVSDVMADANLFSEFLQTLGARQGTVLCHFHCDRKNFLMDGCQAVLEWTATTAGAVDKGASTELTLKGVVRGKFSLASNKLLSASMSCDTGAVLMQLQEMSGNATLCFNDTQSAACQADAILDSLEMPFLSSVPAAVIVNPSCSSSDCASDKGELDSDDSIGESSEKMGNPTSFMTISA